MWGLAPLSLELRMEKCELPCLQVILYANRKGQIALPPRNPYMAIAYSHTPSQRTAHLSHQWLAVSGMLAKEMHGRGLATSELCLPPEVEDVRPWQWLGYRAAVHYTFFIDFPYSLDQAGKAIQEQVEKTIWAGCACGRTEQTSEASRSIQEINQALGIRAKGFSQRELDTALRIVGPEHYRLYICHTQDGSVASVLIVLHEPGCRAIALYFGTRSQYLDMGLARLLLVRVLDDLWLAGATGFDFGGAFPSSIARSNEPLEGRLMPYYGLEEYNMYRFAQWFSDALGIRNMRDSYETNVG
jgi:hypothetical protein